MLIKSGIRNEEKGERENRRGKRKNRRVKRRNRRGKRRWRRKREIRREENMTVLKLSDLTIDIEQDR